MSLTGDEADVGVPAGTRDQVSGSEYEDNDDVKNQSNDEEYESEREGRFHGPDSTWRFYTKEDRAIAASLDQAENNDLSAHLYNAHAWKQRLVDAERIETSLPWQSKRRWLQRDGEGKMPFVPPTSWTAWPMKPEDVPRSREQWGIPLVDPEDATDTFTKPESWRPSLYLHEEIKATFLRRAKEVFHERKRAVTEQGVEIDRTYNSKTVSTASASVEIQDSDEAEYDAKSSRRVKQEVDTDNGEALSSVEERKEIKDEYDTSLLLDDDLAASILRPTVHHLTSMLDDLLIGLHKSRLAHRQDRSRSRGRSAESTTGTKSRGRAASSAGVPSKRKRAVSDLTLPDADFEPESTPEDNESNPGTRSGKSGSRGNGKRVLGPRDWSEVLGVAAMVGWEKDILDRAARRCAATFGEKMTMRIMPEASFDKPRDEVIEYVPELVPLADSDSDSEDNVKSEEEQEEQDEAQFGFSCPEKSCFRYNKPYETRWRLRGHLKKTHKLGKVEVERLVPLPRTPSPVPKTSDSDDLESEQEDLDVKAEGTDEVGRSDAVRLDGFLQPITIRLPRSKDKRPRRRRSLSRRSQADAGSQ